MPTWSPDGRAMAYTSYARGFPTIFISLIYEGRRLEPFTPGTQNWLRELVARRHEDRVHVEPRRQLGAVHHEPRRLGRAAPDEQPGHRHDADLVADGRPDRVHLRPVRRPGRVRHGRRRAEPPQGLHGFELRPRDVGARRRSTSWRSSARRAPATTSRSTSSRRAASGRSPTARAATRARATRRTAATSHSRRREPGKVQIFTIGRDGKGLRQVTRIGNNFTPDWSR